MRFGGERQAFQVVAAFEDRHQAAAAIFGGDVEHDAGEFSEISIGECEFAEWIVLTGVETGGDENEIWMKGGDGGQ